MGPLVGATELSKALVDAGNNLLKPQSSTDATLSLLDEIESLLATVEQDPISSVQNALNPSMKALVSADLLRNPDSDVRVSVVSCLTEIMRITAPEAPYNDDQMEEIFQVTIEAFGKLADASSRSYKKAEGVLETVSKVRSSLVMLDLECDDLVLEMFQQFLKVIRPDHSQLVLLAMETVMITVIDESEEVPMDLLKILLTNVEKKNQDVSPTALRLVEKVLSSCTCKLQPCIMEALKSKGTSLDMYSPVVSSICESKYITTQAHDAVITKENEEDEKISEEQIVPSDLLKDKLDSGVSRNHKGSRSKRTARVGTHQANGDEKVRTGSDLKQLLKHGQSEGMDAETNLDSTRKRGRKPNSLMNPEEGYSFKTSSSKKMQENEDSSLGKVAAKKASLPNKVGQTNQSVVISLSPSRRARTGSRKRSRTKMEETNNDGDSCATPTLKEQVVNKDDPEVEDLMESNLEKPKDGIKTSKATKKNKAQNGLAKISAKKPLAETKMVKSSGKKSVLSDPEEEDLMESNLEKPKDGIKTSKSPKKDKAQSGLAKISAKKPLAEIEINMVKSSGKKSVLSDAEKKNLEGASMDTSIPQSSRSKKKSSRAAMPSAKKAEQTPKSHPKRKRTAGEEVESNTVELGEELVGKRVEVWWPLDEKFYKGVVDSYSSDTKTHRVLYSDGDSEELDMKNERFEIIQGNSSADEDEEIDLHESIPLSDLIRKARVKKRKNASLNVEESSSPEVRSPMQRKKNSATNSPKQTTRTKGVLKTENNEPESKERTSLKSLEEVKSESGKTKGRTAKKQKVTPAIGQESEKDREEKEDPESKGLDSLKSRKETNAESDCLGVHQELPEIQNAETKIDEEKQKSEKEPPKADGEEHNSLKEPNTEPKTNGEEQKAADEATAEPKIDVEECNEAKEINAEPEHDEEECKSPKEANVEPNTEGKEEKSVKEPAAEPEIKVEEKESEKEQPADTKLIENKNMSEAKGLEIDKGTCTSIPETGKVENES